MPGPDQSKYPQPTIDELKRTLREAADANRRTLEMIAESPDTSPEHLPEIFEQAAEMDNIANS